MKQKCSKYQALFTFSSEEELKKHIENCEDCKEEQKTMDRVSSLIKEAIPLIKARERRIRKRNLKLASFALLFFLLGGVFTLFQYEGTNGAEAYGEILGAANYGFPVDSYGLITAD